MIDLVYVYEVQSNCGAHAPEAESRGSCGTWRPSPRSAFDDRRWIEAGDEVAALIRQGASAIEAAVDGDDIHGFAPA
jgi:hypothetical protein